MSSIVVRHAHLGDDAAPADKSLGPGRAGAERLDCLEPIVSWGAASGAPAAEVGRADAGGSARDVQRCLIERARGLPRESAGETGDAEASPDSAGTPNRRRVWPPPAQAARAPSPPRVIPDGREDRQAASQECALRYRLLKRKSGASASAESVRDVGFGPVGNVSALTCHDFATDALRVRIAEALLEKLLKFSGVRKQGGWSTESSTDPAGERNTPVEASVPVALPPTVERFSPRAGDARIAMPSFGGAPVALSSTGTSETSLHCALRSVDVALDLPDAPESCFEPWVAEGAGVPVGEADRATFLVLSLSQFEISGSESASFVLAVAGAQSGAGTRRGSQPYNRHTDEMRQRVCSLSLGVLSVVLVDGLALAAAAGTRAVLASPPPTLAQRVFLTGAGSTVPAIQRLVRVGGVRGTAEILSNEAGAAGSRETKKTAAAGTATQNAPSELLFNASCESVHACASVGGALVVVEACLLLTKTREERARGRDPVEAPGARWRKKWCRGVGASLEGISVGGAVNSGGGQLTGNMRRLSVGRAGGGGAVPAGTVLANGGADIAIFEAQPGTGAAEGLSWSVDVFQDAGGAKSVKLTSTFKSCTLHFANTKQAMKGLKAMLTEFKAEAAATRLFDYGAEAGGAGSDSRGFDGRRKGTPVAFDIRGSAVTMLLPFELVLEVEGARVVGHPLPWQAALARNGASGDGGLDIDMVAEDVQVFHSLYGARNSPGDGQPPSIRCAARGIVKTRPSSRATSVSLQSEHVRVRLTPAFCASFGSFVRLMVGPPARPSTMPVLLAETTYSQPESFTFTLGVLEADVDFITDPCCAGAVSSNVVVGEVSMRQKTTGAVSPGAGSQASFEMSFETVKATQRREARRNGPALPQAAIKRVGAFLGPVPGRSGGDSSGFDIFSAWISARKQMQPGNHTRGTLYVQPFIIALGMGGGANAARAFSVVSTSSGPRHRLINSLSLRLAPMLLACYPPTFRELMACYNRFAGNAFRLFRSRADMPRKRIAVVSYDIDIKGCGAVLLASLADGARGVHVSAGVVRIKETTMAAAGLLSPRGKETHGPVGDDTTLSMSGYVGPAGMVFVRDWRSLLPKTGAGGAVRSAVEKAATPLCVPIDLRWAVSYDSLDRCRQDISLSSVQLYLEQPHFDLCVRVAQVFVAADFPGALPARSPPQPGDSGGGVEIDSFFAMSLRLSLLQVVLAMGKKNGPFPPVLEIDVASVRLARGGTLTVRHVSVNSWPQDADGPARFGTVVTAAGSGSGYCVLARSGHSEESGRDFVRMEVRVQEVPGSRYRAITPSQPQLDVVFQVSIGSKPPVRPVSPSQKDFLFRSSL